MLFYKVFYFVLSLFFYQFCACCCYGKDNNFPLKVEQIEIIFKQDLINEYEVLYTQVPRGLIISFPDDYFFDKSTCNMKSSAEAILTKLSQLIKQVDLPCVVEVNTLGGGRLGNLEISIKRAEIIVEYMIMQNGVNPQKIRSIGFGSMMPFSDNVSYKGNLNNRVDFVIIRY